MNTAEKEKRVRRGSRPAMVALCLLLAAAGSGFAAFGEDIERPRPEFSREDGTVTAKLIPRGKRTSVLIDFKAEGGTLEAVEGVEFESVKAPGVDSKDFRSALFAVTVSGLAPGGECRVALGSAYFTGSTELWAVTPGRPPAWVNSGAESISRPEFVQELVATVADGGPLDADGERNGAVRLIAGPMDSFWGYALGTLFIRFFGIFIVLGLLQAGMMLSGRVFTAMARRAERTEESAAPPLEDGREPQAAGIDPETAAAIGAALCLHLRGARRPAPALPLEASGASAWAEGGRNQIMGERLRAFDRGRCK
jgi:hypothetical protein